MERSYSEADAFRVWRAIRAAEGECTRSELAEATGLPYSTVAAVVWARGWAVVDAPGKRGCGPNRRTRAWREAGIATAQDFDRSGHPVAVDRMMARTLSDA